MASKKVVFVTGGNNGLGYETIKALLQSPKAAAYRILLGSRSLDKAKAAVEKLRAEVPETKGSVEVVQIDLTSDASIERAFEQVKADPGRVDTLVNNAGAAFDMDFADGKITLRERFNLAYDVNVAGTNVVTWTFVPLLLRSAEPRVVFVGGLSYVSTSTDQYVPVGSFPAGWPKQLAWDPIGYRCSKTAASMLMVDWHHKLRADGVKVLAAGPGFLATDLGGARELSARMGAGDPSAGGRFLRGVIEGERDADVGRFVGRDGKILPF